MGKVERMDIGPVARVRVNQRGKLDIGKSLYKVQKKMEIFLFKEGYVLFILAFLLGRALILSQITPFILPFFAATYFVKRQRAPVVLLGLVLGGLTLSINHSFITLISCFIFLALFRVSKKWLKSEGKALPFYVSSVILLMYLGESYFSNGQLYLYDGLMAGVKASLGFILTFIFIQSIPLILTNKKRQALKTEEMVCLIIMLASILTGTIGWSVYDLSLEYIASRYLVLIFAFVAGATIGSTVGVVTGLVFTLANISSFYHLSLLAFSGLLGGLLKEGKKIGVAIGLFIATLLIGMYGESSMILEKALLESGAAIFLFLLTPNAFITKLAKHIPGTIEHAAEQQHYLRKIRDVTAQRVEQFSSVFQALSNSFAGSEEWGDWKENDTPELDYFLSNVTEKTCQMCFKKEHCWTRNFNKTYDYMRQIMHEMEQNGGNISSRLSMDWDRHCSKSKKVIHTIQQDITLFEANQRLKKQVKESRRLVAEQLRGISTVMDDFAKEIQRERDNHYKQEEMILESLQEFGVQIENVEIYSLEKGNVDIDMMLPYCNGSGECEKLIAPMLSDILNESIVVHKENCAEYPGDYCRATFRSAKAFTVETGVAHAAKDGGLVSGDSYSMINLSGGKYAIAISDGMGNGNRAQVESRETLKLLQKILQSGIEETIAIKSVNSILALRTTDEVFSTLDLAMLDLQTAKVKFLKVGSTPSFIRRGKKIIRVQANNLPMGILQDFEVEVVDEQLKAGDLLIMMSDGVFEGPKLVENHELWMRRKISELKTDDPQAVADLIMEEVIRSRSGYIDDDMTVVVAKIKHNTPKWATIPINKYLKKA